MGIITYNNLLVIQIHGGEIKLLSFVRIVVQQITKQRIVHVENVVLYCQFLPNLLELEPKKKNQKKKLKKKSSCRKFQKKWN